MARVSRPHRRPGRGPDPPSLPTIAGRAEVLRHPRRHRLYQRIAERPGIHLRALASDLHLGLGVLRTHLRVLRKAGLIHSRRAGRRRVYFPWSYVGPAGSSRRERLLREIERARGIRPAELARRAGISRMLLNYHLQRLRRSGQVVVQRTHRESRLFAEHRRPAHRGPAGRSTDVVRR